MAGPPAWRVVNDAADRAFDAQVRRDMPALAERCEALWARDPEALKAAFEQARRCGDLKAIEVMAGLLERHGALDAEGQVSLVQALMAQGRFAEAAEGFEHPLIRDLKSARVVCGRAQTLAGAGRFQAALEAAESALMAHPGHRNTENLRERLKVLAPLQAAASELESWPEIGALLLGYLELGVRDAAQAMAAGLMHSPPATLSPQDLLTLGEWALQICPAEEVRAFLPTIPADVPRRQTLVTACDVLSGRAATHCHVTPSAEVHRPEAGWRALACEAAGDLPNAIRQLSALAEEDKRDADVRCALARVVGRRVLDEVRPRFKPGGEGRIVNLVVFNDEFALLRMHLEEMAPFVDRFVIVEAGQTFMGADKPLHFQENRAQFADFADRITHLAIPRFPDELTTAWARDFYQRDMGIAAAQDLCGQEDYVLATDTDELIDARALQGFVGDYACLHLVVSRFFLNYRMVAGSPKASRPASLIIKARYLQDVGVSQARFYLARRWAHAQVIPAAGWHFTSVNDADRIALKLGSYAHQEQVKARFRTPEHFRQILDRIRSGEMEQGWERVELDERMPEYVRRNQGALADLLL